MNKIKISIAMLAYNHERYIEQSIESILKQNHKYDFEIIVGEDCSTDKTREVLKALKEKNKGKYEINLIFRKKNIGTIANIIDVFSKCTGEYIFLLEGDDYWIGEEKIIKSINFLEQNKEYVGTSHNFLELRGKEIKKRENNKEIYNNRKDFYKGGVLRTLTLGFRNIFLDRNKLQEYRELTKNNTYIGDEPLIILLLSNGKIKFFKEDWGVYRIESTNTSWSSKSFEYKIEESVRWYNHLLKIYGYKDKKEIKYKLAKYNIQHYIYYVKNKKYLKAIKKIKFKNIFIIIKEKVRNEITK